LVRGKEFNWINSKIAFDWKSIGEKSVFLKK